MIHIIFPPNQKFLVIRCRYNSDVIIDISIGYDNLYCENNKQICPYKALAYNISFFNPIDHLSWKYFCSTVTRPRHFVVCQEIVWISISDMAIPFFRFGQLSVCHGSLIFWKLTDGILFESFLDVSAEFFYIFLLTNIHKVNKLEH